MHDFLQYLILVGHVGDNEELCDALIIWKQDLDECWLYGYDYQNPGKKISLREKKNPHV